METYFVAKKAQDGRLFLLDPYGWGAWDLRFEDTPKNPKPYDYLSRDWAEHKAKDFASVGAFAVSETELQEKEMGY